MAQWRKVVVSGSSPEFAVVSASSDIYATGNIKSVGDLTVAGGDITLGGTSIFSGGDTTSLNNIDAIDATTESTIEAAIDTLSNLTTVGALNAGSITSGFTSIDVGSGAITTTGTISGGDGTYTGTISGSAVYGTTIGQNRTDGVKTITIEANSTINQDVTSDASPQFTGIELGHASDTTITRASSGDLNIEGNLVYRAGGTDVPVADGGTGASTLTDGGVLLGSGTGAITAMSVLSDGEMIVGDGSTDPVAESGATLRTSIGVGTSDNVVFNNVTGVNVSGSGDAFFGQYGVNYVSASGGNIQATGYVSASVMKVGTLTTSGTFAISEGGTGVTSLTDKAVLISQDSGTDAIGALALTGNGEIIVGGTNGPAVEAAADVAGTGLDASTGDGTLAINVAAAQTSITSIINTGITKIGTATNEEYIDFSTSNEVNTKIGNSEILSVTADGVDVTGAVTISGNLDVNGSLTTIDSTNLRVADRFIYASSGSTSGDGGLIVGTGANGIGTAIGYDDSVKRWGLTKEDDTAHDDTAIAPRQYVVSVSGSATAPGTNPHDFGTAAGDRIGLMHVNTDNGEIWIYS